MLSQSSIDNQQVIMFKPKLGKSIASEGDNDNETDIFGSLADGEGDMQNTLMRIDGDETNEFDDDEDEAADEEDIDDQENLDEFDENMIQEANGFAQTVQFYVKIPRNFLYYFHKPQVFKMFTNWLFFVFHLN